MEFICEQLSDAGIYSPSKISKTDDTYVSYINNNISLCEYLKYAISQGAIDISCISTKSDYYDTDEIYNVLTEYILKEFENAKIYVDLFPCNECAKLIIQSGIKEVIYLSDKYNGTDENIASKRLFDTCKVKYKQIECKEITI